MIVFKGAYTYNRICMNKVNKNEKGFSVVELLLVIVVLVFISAVSWYVYEKHHNSSTAKNNTSRSVLESYIDPQLGFSIRPPAGWSRDNTDAYNSATDVLGGSPFILTSWSQPKGGASLNVEIYKNIWGSLEASKDAILGFTASDYQGYNINNSHQGMLDGQTAYFINDTFSPGSDSDASTSVSDTAVIENLNGLSYYIFGYTYNSESIIRQSVNSFSPSTNTGKSNTVLGLLNNGGSSTTVEVGPPGSLQPKSTLDGDCGENTGAGDQWSSLTISGSSTCDTAADVAFAANGSNFASNGYSCIIYPEMSQNQWYNLWDKPFDIYICSDGTGQIAFTWLKG
jgi:hypothetical protein